MHLELTDDEAAALHDVLSTWLGDVSVEIRHTDNRSVRSGLRARRESLRRIVDRLDVSTSGAVPPGP
ncbi:MAG: hypothetical protein GEU96_08510 [Propionibacteriales bacterium]|nr:hypothetical protein [Propionibacteriales bacterium]